jgi:hypothetical protein
MPGVFEMNNFLRKAFRNKGCTWGKSRDAHVGGWCGPGSKHHNIRCGGKFAGTVIRCWCCREAANPYHDTILIFKPG